MRKLLLSLLFICVCAATIAQTVTLTFTAQDAENHYVQLNRVAIANLTKGWQEIISWPDTVLTMQDGTGVDDYTENGGLALSQNNPNPFDGATFVNLKVAEQGNVAIEITDITGRIVGANKYSSLQPGIHEMRITLSSPGLYFLTARQNGRTVSVKMVNRGHGGGNAVTITGVVGANHDSPLPQPKNAHRGATDNPFEAGDRMEYVGYAVINGVEVESNHVLRQQYASQMLMLTFGNPQGDSLSCPGSPTVVDVDGNIYNTVQIGDQCWMRENLRVTHYSDGTPVPAGGENDGSFTEPCYYDYSSSGIPLAERGYLYNWPAAMHGAASSNVVPSLVQGVCPNGWHLPSNMEWTVLMDYTSYMAKALASTTWWESFSGEGCPGNQNVTANNASGFGAVPAGGWSGWFIEAGCSANFWSSTEDGSSNAYLCLLYYCYSSVFYNCESRKDYGFSVRCLRDYIAVTTGTVSIITDSTATCGGNVISDGGATVTARGVCWSTSQNPTVSDNHTTDGGGMGSYISSINGLTYSTTYYVRAYATNSQGTAYGGQLSFTTAPNEGQPCYSHPTVTDYDGNVYNTVQIGDQCWMRENLRVVHYSDGTPIPAGGNDWNYWSETEPYYYDYSSSGIPGYLYNWPAAMHGVTSSSAVPSGVQGVCPTGWHLPSDAEWTVLTDYVSSQSEYTCGGVNDYIAKALASTSWWESSNCECCPGNQSVTANNASGFGAVPAGGYWGSGVDEAGYYAGFWSSTENGSRNAYNRGLNYSNAYVGNNYNEYYKFSGFSVRCLRD